MWNVHFSFPFIFYFGLFFTLDAVRHERNLIWTMSPPPGSNGVSRIVGIGGDPVDWIRTGNITVRHISAPHSGWQFRGLAYHYASQTLFWSERSSKRVQGLPLNGSTSTLTVFSGTSNEIDGVVVDWISNNIYFADPKYNWIMMVPINSTKIYKRIVSTGLDKPHGLAIYPKKGYLFWSDYGFVPKIEMSDLLGQNRRSLVIDDIVRPRGLTVDYTENKLYWVDGGKKTIERIEFNGNNRRTLVQAPSTEFYGIALYDKYLFVTEQEEGHLRIYDKLTGKGYINYQLGNIPRGIIMYDEDMQQGDTSGCAGYGCEHICVDTPLLGSTCLCGDGYEIGTDQKSCEETQYFDQPSLIYAIGDAICKYPINLADMSLVNVTLDSQCFLKTRKGFTALTFDGRNKFLYYTENMTNSIGRVQLRKGAFTDTVIRGVGEIKGITLDWTTDTLYWTDSEFKHIMVAKTDGRFQKTLIETDLDHPLGIAVHPSRGELYWTDPGRSTIEVANMNGDNRRPLALDSTNINHPNHLFIDFQKNILYWSDSELNHIASYDLNTQDFKVVYRQQSSRFFGVSVYQDYLIWTDTDKLNGIHVADLTTGTKQRGILHPKVGVSADVVTYHIDNQPIDNAICYDSVCEQLCLPSSNTTFLCSCGTGFEISDDGRTCISGRLRNNFLVVTDAYQRQLFQVGIEDGSVHAIPMTQHYRPIAIDYDAMRQHLYWTDNQAKVIKGGNIAGKSEFTVKVLEKSSVIDGIAVDYINRLLYFTDTGLNRITVTSLVQIEYSKTVISEDLDEPRDIVVHPLDGRMFWTDWGDDAKIEAADMDGAERVILVNLTTKSWPNGLALDYKERKLYWTDAQYDKVETIDMNGRGRKVLYQDPKSHYFGITLLQDYLYITDWTKNYVSRLRKSGEGAMERVGPSKFSRLNGIIAYHWDSILEGRSACYDSSCDQLCLPKPMFKYLCACIDLYTLRGNKCRAAGDNSTDFDTTTKGDGVSDAVIVTEQNTTTDLVTSSVSDAVIITEQSTSTDLVTSSVSDAVIITEQNTATDLVTLSGDKIRTTPDVRSPRIGKPPQKLQTSAIIIIVIVGVTVAIVATAASVYLYRRRHSQSFRHDRLVEEDRQVDTFYRITFPDNKDEPNIDSGIHNPSFNYNQINQR